MTARKTQQGAALITLWGQGRLISHRVDKDEFRIGRSSDNDLVLKDALVSRHHARLRRAPEGWVLEDLGSRHGTRVGGHRARGTVPLDSGARFELGAVEILFELAPSPADQATTSRATARTEEAPQLVGESAAMERLRALLAKVAGSTLPALLLGESGTGKEIAARIIHRSSPRADQAYVVVNCPALPGSLLEAELFGIEKHVATGVAARRGKLEEAAGGTLFLDEVGDLESGAQAKLLRFLQERTIERVGGRRTLSVDTRVIAATHHDLLAEVSAQRFRLDLFYRLNTLALVLPPLRERREDIPLLVDHFLAQRGEEGRRFSAEALALLQRYPFPGNVRELRSVVERAALLSEDAVIPAQALALPGGAAAVPVASGSAASLLRRLEAGASFWERVHRPFLRRELPPDVVRALVAAAYAKSGGSYRRMAERMGITSFKEYKKLTDFLRNHGLHDKL